MNLDKVSSHFEKEAFVYDDLILRLIPNYDEQHEVINRLLPFPSATKLTALDLGCGTGILSFLILKKFTEATVVAYDLAENMLKVCQSNLEKYKERLILKQGDFGSDEIGQGYDIILSGLSIHHLNNAGKKVLYKRLYESLNPGGIFINREIVLGETPNLTERYHQIWRDYIRSNGEDDEMWFNKYIEEDIPASVGDQLDWLKEAGFVDVGCHWRYINFAIFGGTKPCAAF